MAIPTKADIEKRRKKLESLIKQLDENGTVSDKKLCTILRSEIRKTWMRHPVKLAYLEKGIYPDMNPTTRTKWLCDCELCGRPTKLSDIEIDHVKGEHKLLELTDVVPFTLSILKVTENDLQRLCCSCHDAKTYADRAGISFEEAKKEKKVIAKLKQPVTKQKAELKRYGYAAKDISNETKRRECYREILIKEE